MLLGKRRGKIKELKCIKNARKSEEERGKESKPVAQSEVFVFISYLFEGAPSSVCEIL